jgi:Leucine-rich repeat (LRR) protein
MKTKELVCWCNCITTLVAVSFLGTLVGFIWSRSTAHHWTNGNNNAKMAPKTAEYYKFLRGQILSESGFDRSLTIALDDPRSYEWKALQWMFAHDAEVDASSPVLQRFALVAAFLSLDVDVTATIHECDWVAVQCNDQRQITSMNFPPRSLTGGTIPSVMTFLSGLEVLDMTDQGLKGRLPSPHSWPRLRELKLGGNRLTSVFNTAVPAKDNTTTLSSWPIHIETIDLRGNDLTETIGAPVASWTKLRYLDLSGNSRLSSSTLLDELHWRTIEHLNIAETNITGRLPANVDYSALQVLAAGSAPLTGLLPESLGDASNLRILLLGRTLASNLTGTLPESYGRLTQLEELSITNTDVTGTLPSAWGSLTKLRSLDLSDNPSVIGAIPDAWRNLTSLEIVSFVNTGVSGTVPSSVISQWTELRSLSLHRSGLSGIVPPEICDELPHLTEITANCKGDVPDVDCPCCTFCLSRDENTNS